MGNEQYVKCGFESQGPCFARHTLKPGLAYCKILSSRINKARCPFCKPERDVTDGIRYDFVPKYSYTVIKEDQSNDNR